MSVLNKNTNPKSYNEFNTLYKALMKNNLVKIKELIENGIDVDIKDDYNTTLLIYAVENNNIDIIKFLIEKGADVNVQNKDNNTPLMAAVIGYNTKIAKLLIESGADVNNNYNNKYNPLIFSTSFKYTDMAKLLIEKGANINIKDNINNTPLMIAVKNNNTEIAKLLIEKGSDINLKYNFKNYNTLMYAAENNNKELVELLLKKGVKYSHKNSDGYNIIKLVTEKYKNDIKNVEIVKMLCTYIIKNIDKFNYTIYTTLYYDINEILNKISEEIDISMIKDRESLLAKKIYYKILEVYKKFFKPYDELDIIKPLPFKEYMHYFMNEYSKNKDKYVNYLYEKLINEITKDQVEFLKEDKQRDLNKEPYTFKETYALERFKFGYVPYFENNKNYKVKIYRSAPTKGNIYKLINTQTEVKEELVASFIKSIEVDSITLYGKDNNKEILKYENDSNKNINMGSSYSNIYNICIKDFEQK